MGMTLQGAEVECAKRLAKLFEGGALNWNNQGNYEDLGLTAENYPVVLAVMQECGIITDPIHTFRGRYFYFKISASVLQVVRQIEQQQSETEKGPDIVEQIKSKAKRSSLMAWTIIAFMVLVGLATFINQTIQIFQNLGWVRKP